MGYKTLMLKRTAGIVAAIVCVTPVHLTVAADIMLAIKSEAAFECLALAANGPDERRLLGVGLDLGRRFFSEIDPAKPSLTDVEKLGSLVFMHVAHYEYHETGSADFALGALSAYVSQRVGEEITRVAVSNGQDESDVKEQQFRTRNCAVLP